MSSDGAVMWLRAGVDELTDSGYEVIEDHGTMYFQRKLSSSSNVKAGQKTYDAVQDRWWRVREASGSIYYETSADGRTFTPRASEPTSLPIDRIRIHLGVAVYDTTATMPGHVRFAHLNLPPS
jgi:hypothetical protein